MIPSPAQRTVNLLRHRYLRASLIEHPPPWLPKRTESILLGRQPTKTERDYHILRTTGVSAIREWEAEATRDLETEVAREAEDVEEIKGIEEMGQVEELGWGPIRRKKSGAQNGRM